MSRHDLDQTAWSEAQKSLGQTPGFIYAALRRYRCHKEVMACKIAYAFRFSDGSAILLVDDVYGSQITTSAGWMQKCQRNPYRNGDQGYYVRYEDGYESWSPTEAFEGGYSLVVAEPPSPAPESVPDCGEPDSDIAGIVHDILGRLMMLESRVANQEDAIRRQHGGLVDGQSQSGAV